MAFNKSNAQRSTNADTNSNESWKAQGYLNLYLPSQNGGRRKLGAIPLKDSKANEATLRTWLEADPENINTLLSKIEMEYQPAAQSEGAAFDLS